MIYVGPDDEKSCEPLSIELPVNDVLSRSSFELEILGDAVANLEHALVSNQTLTHKSEVRTILQSIAPIQQSLQALVSFLTTIAKEPCEASLQVESALSSVHLEAVKNRLGQAI